MSILVGIFAAACAMLCVFMWVGRRRFNRVLQADQAFAARIWTLYDVTHGKAPAAEGQGDIKAIVAELKSACNEQVERHEDLDELHRSVMVSSVMTAVIGMIAAVTVLLGA